jgi:CheY-like chemotaxis protein
MQYFETQDRFTRRNPMDAASSSPMAAVTDAPEPSRGRVLVMDDEVAILELTSRLLKSRGYQVETALDGNRAVSQYQAAMDAGCPFDLLILDLTVPEKMGGYDAFKAIRLFDPRVKAIVSSGYSHEPIVVIYREYGLAGVAPKPYKMSELLGAVERAIG